MSILWCWIVARRRERLAELAAMPDNKIDTSDIPEADEAFFKSAKLLDKSWAERVSMGLWHR